MDQPDDLTQTLAAVGRILLAWGWLETEMTAALDRHGAPPHPSPIARWRRAHDLLPPSVVTQTPEIERLAGLRNLIAHGLVSARSEPEPEVQVRTPAGVLSSIDLVQLNETSQALDRLRLVVRSAR